MEQNSTPQPEQIYPNPQTPDVNPAVVPGVVSATPAQPQNVYPEPQQPSVYYGPVTDQPAEVTLVPAKQSRFNFIKNKKSLAIPVVVLCALLGTSAAAYFGYYVPNKPENIWNSAMINTGKAYDKLSAYATNYDTGKSTAIKGDFKISGDVAADGDISGVSDNENSDVSGHVSAAGLKVNYDVRTIKSAGNTPDIYFKVDGLQGLGDLFGSGDPTLTQGINSLNGQWYFIDHSFFDQFAKGANTNTQFNSKDAKSILDAVGKASKQYIFTSDESKQAFTLKSKVGKEKQDNRNVYHYKVGVNKTNLKAYVNSLCSNLKGSSLKKVFGGDDQTAQQAIGCDSAGKSIDSMDLTGSADAWVDTHTKLIHKVRFTDKTNKDNYLDVIQDYQGGDSIPFGLAVSDKSSGDTFKGDLKLVLNTKTNTVIINGQGTSTGSTKASGNFNLSITPSSTAVKVQTPTPAKNLIQLLNDLGFGSLFNSVDSAGPSAKDTERQTDIRVLQSQLEASEAQNGYYPTLAQMNNASWRHSNMAGLDEQALQDPSGGSAVLATSPGAGVYAYQPTPANCNNTTVQCNDYTLTATLEGGTTFVKHSLNAPTFQSG